MSIVDNFIYHQKRDREVAKAIKKIQELSLNIPSQHNNDSICKECEKVLREMGYNG